MQGIASYTYQNHDQCHVVHSTIGVQTLQIADFGMARDLEDDNYYVSQGKGKIPVKWTAPEVHPFTYVLLKLIDI